MSLNPKIPITRGADATLIGSARGLRINLANTNTWTGTQTFQGQAFFQNNANFSGATYLQSTTYNNGTFYNYGNIITSGTLTGDSIELTDSLTVGVAGGLVYEYPYASNYTLGSIPVQPSTIGGNTSYAGSLYDDGAGNLFDSYYGQIATIDYATGVVTDITYGYVTTNFIQYYQAVQESKLFANGTARFTAGLIDASSNISLNPYNRKLYAADGTTVVADWGYYTGTLTGANQTYQVDITNGGLVDASSVCVDWASRRLNATASYGLSLDWENRTLYDSDGSTVVAQWSGWGGYLYLPNGLATNLIQDGNAATSINTASRTLNDTSGATVAAWIGGSSPYYEYPYASGYTLANTPVTPSSIGGNTSTGSISDDGVGNITDSYFGLIATIDYATGIVTDTTSGAVTTNYISYTVTIPTRFDVSGVAKANDYEFSTTMQAALTAGDWATAPPTTLIEALNRISAVVSVGGTVPIP